VSDFYNTKFKIEEACYNVTGFIIENNISLSEAQFERATASILMGGDVSGSVMSALDLNEYSATRRKFDKTKWSVEFWAIDHDAALSWAKNNLDDYEDWTLKRKEIER